MKIDEVWSLRVGGVSRRKMLSIVSLAGVDRLPPSEPSKQRLAKRRTTAAVVVAICSLFFEGRKTMSYFGGTFKEKDVFQEFFFVFVGFCCSLGI